ncbi:phage tail protein [Treponema peruense]|uniref:Uncharacterized protein n=1 Tax=Treponema peruense TaxID=2787628 RepID=A0A7T3RDB4_9SPIR|nr:hypothetical protein [Treponema peruense]QQA01012.1 hypothetical protein IWA51_12295 [Treponema peruense]
MKGKKIFRNCIGALALLLGLAGCQNSLEGDSVSGEGIEGLRTLTVEIKNYSEFVEESSVQANMFAPARSIMPDAFKTSDTLSYYLYGKASNGEEKEWTSVTVENGKFTLDVEPYNWNLTLAVTADAATKITEADDLAAVKGKAVLIGYAAVDLTRHANSASFTLKPDGLTTPGKVNLTTKLLDDWTIPASIESVTLGIYNLTNGTVVNYSGDTTTVQTAKKAAGTLTFPATFGESSKDLAPGTYTFKVEFLNAKNECEAEWSDSIVILPGKTNGTAVAIPNVIGTVPAKVTTFTASYVAGTEDSTPGFYDVKFDWVGKDCVNERYFEIDLLDVTGSTVAAIPTDETTWESAVTDSGNTAVTYGAAVIEDQLYTEGSLLANNKWLTMKLELGKAYVARIRAVNRAGSSANTYVTVGAGNGTGTVFGGTFINLFRIRYNLQGGTYTPETGSAQTTPIVRYASTETAYLVPDTSEAATTNILVKNSLSWTKWQDSGKKDIDVAATPNYSGPANIDLYACYTTDADVNIFNAADYKLDASWITVGKNNVALTGTDPSYTVSVSKADALDDTGALIWTVNVADKGATSPITTGFAYDSVTFAVSAPGTKYYSQTQEAVAVGTPATFTQTGAKLLESGTYNVLITAKSGTTTVTLPVALTITD